MSVYRFTINDENTNTFVMKVLEDNNFSVLGNITRKGRYTPGQLLMFLIWIIRVNEESGEIVDGGEIKINYVSASDIYPLSWCNGYITECAFTFYKIIGTKKYAHIQMHLLENGLYVIENHIVECTNGAGKEIPVEDWKKLKGFENLSPKMETGMKERQFVIDRLNITNNYEKDNPMGVAIFANSIDVLQGLDTVYDSYINEFVLGKKRIFVAPENEWVTTFLAIRHSTLTMWFFISFQKMR